MQNLFVNLNRYMSRRKALFISLILVLTGVVGYIASGIRLEENLNAIIPEDQRISKISAAFDRSELAEQIVFIVSLRDTSAADPSLLLERAEVLVELLSADTLLVNDIEFRYGNEAMLEVYDFMYRNLPFFLEEADYELIGDKLDETSVDETLKTNFKTLMTPAGSATRDFILKDPLSLTPLALGKLTKFQMDDNFTLFRSAIFTRDRKQLLLFLDPVHPGSNTRENQKLIRLIEHSINTTLEDDPGTRIDYYGGTAVAVANSMRVKADIKLTLSIALAMFLLIFLAFFRRFNVMILLFVPVILGALISLAMLTILYGKVSAIALGVGVIFIGITVDYSLHLFTHFRAGGSLEETIRRISLPVMMSSLTTASAFLCLTIIRSEALNQIGIFAAFAVIASALALLTVTPLLIPRKNGIAGSRQGKGGIVERAVAYNFESNRLLVAVILMLTIVFAFTSRQIRFNGDISTLNYQTEKLDQAEARLNEISSVASSTVYLVTRGKSMGEALQKLESNRTLLESCRREGVVNEISMAADLIPGKEIQKEKIDVWNSFWNEAGQERVVESMRRLGRKYHFRDDAFADFYALISRDFNPVPLEDFDPLRVQFLDNYIASDEEGFSLITMLKVDPGQKDQLFSRVSGSEDFIIFDNQYFINRFFDVLRDDFNKLVTISMIVVFFILLVFFGRIEIAAITFIPIMISWTWTLGLMGLFNIEINIFNIIISTFVFGLGIDYSIFIMNGIIARYRDGKHGLTPYKLSILLSALTTIAGIGVLIFAKHPALQSIAIVSIFGISTVVLISYTLLPLLFSFLTRSKGKERLEPVTLFSFLISLVTFFIFLGCALVVTVVLPLFMILPVGRRRRKSVISHIIFLFSRFIVTIGFFVRKQYIDMDLLDFSRPSILICNHQSQLDLVLMLMLHPRIIVLVNEWVWKNPFYGPIIRFADFYPVYKGLDHNFERIRKKVDEGYSILAFPESSRSPDGSIKRFHQGAFGMADLLGLEIQPVLIHGAYNCLPKTEHFLKPGTITLKSFPRIKVNPVEYEGVKTYREQAKEVTAFYRFELARLRQQVENTAYFRPKLISRFKYKGPVLEWYLRVKMNLEKNYAFFHEVIPGDAAVVDLGCGYGFLSLMLGYTSGKRRITGIDYDHEKIAVASNAANRHGHISFVSGDITSMDIPGADVFILNDVLHYLPAEEQYRILGQCMQVMSENGMVVMRDADAELRKRTMVTRFTEFQSTRLFRFNKSLHKLTYLPGDAIRQFVQQNGCVAERYDRARLTSNITYIIRRQPRDE